MIRLHVTSSRLFVLFPHQGEGQNKRQIGKIETARLTGLHPILKLAWPARSSVADGCLIATLLFTPSCGFPVIAIAGEIAYMRAPL